MPQLSLYLDEKSMDKLRADASRAGVSLSKYAGEIINERAAAHSWPKGYWDLFGSLEGYSFEAPTEVDFSLDRARGW